jgi:hypothetical protein
VNPAKQEDSARVILKEPTVAIPDIRSATRIREIILASIGNSQELFIIKGMRSLKPRIRGPFFEIPSIR